MGLGHSHHHGHDHGHDHGHEHHGHGGGASRTRALSVALAITLVFMAVEFGAGWYANSLALMSDALHMATDAGAIALSLFAAWMARRPKSKHMTFGYQRAEILGALANGLVIWLIAGAIALEAFSRFQDPPEVDGPVVIGVAALGLAANVISMFVLRGAMPGGAKHADLNMRGAYLHLLSDCLGSVGAIIAGVVIWRTGWRPIDPIITVIFSALMLVSSWRLVREAVSVLMESTPQGVDFDRVREELEKIPGVSEAHDLHIWTVGTGQLALSVHLISPEGETILAQANTLLEERYSIIHTTIQIEHPDRFSSERCYDCAH